MTKPTQPAVMQHVLPSCQQESPKDQLPFESSSVDFGRLIRQVSNSMAAETESEPLSAPDDTKDSRKIEEKKEDSCGLAVSFLAELLANASCTPPTVEPRARQDQGDTPRDIAVANQNQTGSGGLSSADSAFSQPGPAGSELSLLTRQLAGQPGNNASSQGVPTASSKAIDDNVQQQTEQVSTAKAIPADTAYDAEKAPGEAGLDAEPVPANGPLFVQKVSQTTASEGYPGPARVETQETELALNGVGNVLGAPAEPDPQADQSVVSMPAPVANSPPTPVQETEDGMSAAPRESAMMATRELNENAGSAEQNLPTQTAVQESNRFSGRNRKAGLSADGVTDGNGAGLARVNTSQPSGVEFEAVRFEEKKPAANAVDVVSRTLETASVTLKRMDAASVSMVLKPDGDTQLTLHMKWQQGRLEAIAVLDRGSAAALNAEWSQLQQRLGDQGVRLAPLVSGANPGASFTGGGFGSSRQQDDLARDLGPAGVSAAAKNLPRPSGVRTKPASNGREWWA